MKKTILCFVGPSGAGKSTLIEALPDVPQVWSHTTRKLRGGSDRRIVISEVDFIGGLQRGEYAQAISYNKNWYGLRFDDLTEQLQVNQVAAVDCTQEGLCQLRNAGILPAKNVLGYFVVIDPKALLQRLIQRGESSPAIRTRLQQARKEVLHFARNSDLYDLVIINDELDASVEKVCRLLHGEYLPSDPFEPDRFVRELDVILSHL